MRVPLEINESPTARERGRAEVGQTIWTANDNKQSYALQELTCDLEAIANWRDELNDLLHRSWAMTPRQFDRLEIALAAFAAFTRLCAMPLERQHERRAA